jgi:stage III sporulation protein AC
LDIDLIFKVAGIGILISILGSILKQSNKEEYAQILTLVGVIIVFTVVIQLIGQLFASVRTVFKL